MQTTGYSCQVLNETRTSSIDFSKNTQVSKLTKIRSVVTELLHAAERTDRQTDRREDANSRSSQFCEWAQNWWYGLSNMLARAGFCLAQVMTFYLARLLSHLAATSPDSVRR
jgi:hypothetical protein